LKALPASDSNKVLRDKKNRLINLIIEKGSSDWKGKELSEYSRNLQKRLQDRKEEVVYALGVE